MRSRRRRRQQGRVSCLRWRRPSGPEGNLRTRTTATEYATTASEWLWATTGCAPPSTRRPPRRSVRRSTHGSPGTTRADSSTTSPSATTSRDTCSRMARHSFVSQPFDRSGVPVAIHGTESTFGIFVGCRGPGLGGRTTRFGHQRRYLDYSVGQWTTHTGRHDGGERDVATTFAKRTLDCLSLEQSERIRSTCALCQGPERACRSPSKGGEAPDWSRDGRTLYEERPSHGSAIAETPSSRSCGGTP